jgi:hypothetical protein
MPAGFAIVLASARLILSVVDGPPTLDVEPGCRGVRNLDPVDAPTFESCMRDEQGARTQLRARWSEFSAASRQECTAETELSGGSPSYVELLECLTMARDASGPSGTRRPRR